MRERRPHPWMSLGQRVIPTTPPPECGTEASPPSPPPKKDPTPDPTDAQVGEGMGEGPDDTVFAGRCRSRHTTVVLQTSNRTRCTTDGTSTDD